MTYATVYFILLDFYSLLDIMLFDEGDYLCLNICDFQLGMHQLRFESVSSQELNSTGGLENGIDPNWFVSEPN